MKGSNKTEFKKALLVGVSDYAFFPNLKFCESDAREMAKVLSGPPIGYDVVSLAGQVDSEEMRDATRNFFPRRKCKI